MSVELTRTDVIDELRRLAATMKKPLAARDLPGVLWFAVRRHFGSIDEARRAAGIDAPDLSRRWSRKTVIAEIRRLHRTGVRITDLGLHDHRGLLSAMRTYVGSIVDARRAAGIPQPAAIGGKRQRWDEAQVIAEIEELHRSGQSLAASKVPNRLSKAGVRYFGSWPEALEAAGFDADEIRLVREPYSKDEIVDLLRDLAERRPTMSLGQVYEQGFMPAVMRLFGNIDEALAYAKLVAWPVRERLAAMSRDDVLATIRRREREGKATNYESVHADDYHLWYSGILHFGEWRRAAEVAGVEMDAHNRKWTRESLLDALRERGRRGLSMRPSDIRREDGGLYASVIWHFGSYAAGYRAVGLRPPTNIRPRGQKRPKTATPSPARPKAHEVVTVRGDRSRG